MKFRVVDFEGTGIPSETEKDHRLVEVAFTDLHILPDGGTMIVDMWSSLTLPKREIPPEAKAVHHITEAECEASGILVEHAFKRLMQDPPDFFVAHNADYERHFFAGGETPWIDTYKVAVRVYADAPGHSNQVLRYWLGLDLKPELSLPAHRAGPDTYVTASILKQMIDTNAIDIGAAARWSKGPALLPRIMFGKHKGMKFSEAPTDYLQWMAKQADMDRDKVATAKYWLKERGA